jgi:hypothetical protein
MHYGKSLLLTEKERDLDSNSPHSSQFKGLWLTCNIPV